MTKQCDRITRKVPQVEALRQGRNPRSGCNLDTRPRRLCKRDVGSYGWNGEGRPDDCLELVEQHAVHYPSVALDHSELAVSVLHAEEDPLGLGHDIG